MSGPLKQEEVSLSSEIEEMDHERVVFCHNKATDRSPVEVVPANNVFNANLDIYAPCAFGGILNDENIEKPNCDIVTSRGLINKGKDDEANRTHLWHGLGNIKQMFTINTATGSNYKDH